MEEYGEEKKRAIFALHFAKVKAAIKQPKKSHTVKVDTKRGKSYSYKYADLADVDKAVMDAIRATADKDKNPLLTYFFDITNDASGVQVETVLMDAKTGFMMRTNRIWFKNSYTGDAQTTAALMSYAKRYSLSGAFGIASEDDDDAQHVPDQTDREIVDHAGLKIIWNSYIKDHSEDAKAWLFHSQHNKATWRAIKEDLADYRIEQAEKDKANRAAKPKKSKKQSAVEQAVDKIESTKAKDDADISKLVDGGGSTAKDDQTGLFGDIVGDK